MGWLSGLIERRRWAAEGRNQRNEKVSQIIMGGAAGRGQKAHSMVSVILRWLADGVSSSLIVKRQRLSARGRVSALRALQASSNTHHDQCARQTLLTLTRLAVLQPPARCRADC